MAVKSIVLLLVLATLAAAAPKSRNYFADYLFRRESGGCSEEELQELAASGVDLAKSSIDCGSDFPQLDGLSNVPQLDEMDKEKRSCNIDYAATPACCSPTCDWIMELHCMSPVQMICKKK